MTVVWFATWTLDARRCENTLAAWRSAGYRSAVIAPAGSRVEGAAASAVIHPGEGIVSALNRLCREVVPREAEIVVLGPDDLLPDVQRPPARLADEFFDRFPDRYGVMQPDGDGRPIDLQRCSGAWLGRKWIDRAYDGQGPLCAEYAAGWADHELFWVAAGLGRLWTRPDVRQDFVSRRPAGLRASPQDDEHDARLFLRRAWLRFPGHAPAGIPLAYDPHPLALDGAQAATRHLAAHHADEAERRRRRERLRATLLRWSEEGRRPAMYGAGAFTRSMADVLADSPVPIDCVIDDRAAGSRLWGLPIVTRDEAIARGVDAVYLATDAHAGALWDRCGELIAAGADVVRPFPVEPSELLARVREAAARLAAGDMPRAGLLGRPELIAAVRAAGELPDVFVCAVHGGEGLPSDEAGGLPLVPFREALTAGLHALVLLDPEGERRLWDQTEPLRTAGVRVLPLLDHGLRAAAETEPGIFHAQHQPA